ncbi:hypothetical protein D0T53_02560 [Dysgonomonas sp. 216]|uniref:hypothetical protein n=1 Tax=Dysgonomonas sp. 216 TaxID=2302934 RepID=UPI0013D58AAB|nr:hypothetical protein [Dysgonomonas sp. 216]NDW17797.1 hypothetical protein [Dysgonomonas sp. 216]
MSRFLLGLAVGALGTFAAIKLADKETRDEIYEDLENAAEKAKAKLEQGYKTVKGKSMRAGVVVRQEVRKSKKKVNETAGDIAGKLAENLSEFEAKARAKAQ